MQSVAGKASNFRISVRRFFAGFLGLPNAENGEANDGISEERNAPSAHEVCFISFCYLLDISDFNIATDAGGCGNFGRAAKVVPVPAQAHPATGADPEQRQRSGGINE
ncbi:hypothetical protein [Methylomonas koyamae]|uniref:hypothetical protein n=1 Tax=Methylomonas koyamae TaxID=702114 RepID=UPI002872F924|nr:hypothetical protein [Methylomonas koyamae]WNB77971.1 hypothetical protein RI210_10405 [Methylomonas koyamae]